MSKQPFTLSPGNKFRLKDFDPGWTGKYQDKGEAKPHLQENLERLNELQDMLYAQNKHALTRCNTQYAPWYVIPANRNWCRNLAISDILVQTLEKMGLAYPDPVPDIESYVIE